jgi:orotate phosphoribosyltransferase
MKSRKDIEKEDFIRFILEANVLTWGEFTLKSGRVSPYFFNAGLFHSGDTLRRLGEFYAHALIQSKLPLSHLFGPAYKGIPLATATAIALAQEGIHVDVTFNRKEIKKHGEGGELMGAPLQSSTPIMIDDVITAGTAFRESHALINKAGGNLSAVIIALDRKERGPTGESALLEIEAQGIQVCSIITFYDLLDYLKNNNQLKQLEQLENYHAQYGS